MPVTTPPRCLVCGFPGHLPRRHERPPIAGIFVLIALCAALDARAAHAQLAFGPRTDYAAGSAPSAVAVGDLNRDGLLDFVVTGSAGNSVDAYLGDGFGHFGAIFDSPTGRFPAHVALGDLDGDGILDAVTADRDDNMLSLFRGRGDGSFFPRATINAGPSPVFVAIGDMNGDGRPDLVVAN